MRLKRVAAIFGISILFCLLPVTAGEAAAGWGRQRGRIRDGVPEMRFMLMLPVHRINLDLTPEQEEQIMAVCQDLQRDTLALRQKLQRLRMELRRLWAAGTPDAAAINQKLAETTPLKIELQTLIREAQEKVRALLTPEQLEKLESATETPLRRKGRTWRS